MRNINLTGTTNLRFYEQSFADYTGGGLIVVSTCLQTQASAPSPYTQEVSPTSVPPFVQFTYTAQEGMLPGGYKITILNAEDNVELFTERAYIS